MTQPKLPPHSVEAEQAVIGGLLLSGRAWDDVAGELQPEDFYREDHRIIFDAMSALAMQNFPIDVVTLTEWLRKASKLDKAGGAVYLGSLAADTPSAANIRAYAAIVRESSARRRLIKAGTQVAGLGYEPGNKSIADLLAEADTLIVSIARVGGRGGFIAAPQYVDQALDRLQTAYDSGNDIVGLRSGFNHLDQLTGGFRGSDLVILAGRSSMGKSAFAFNMARRMCEQGKRVAAFSSEMPAKDIADRMVSDISGIELDKIRRPIGLAPADWEPLAQAYDLVSKFELLIDDTSALTITELRARARQKHREKKLDLVVIDYLQLYRAHGANNRENEVAEISRGLKSLAKDLDCPVIALAQLNRKLEERTDKRPRLSDLRESGSIEQDADLVMFLYRDDVYDDKSPHKDIAELIIGKQRNGPLGKVDLAYLGDRTSFQPYCGPDFEEREQTRPRKARHFQFNSSNQNTQVGA